MTGAASFHVDARRLERVVCDYVQRHDLLAPGDRVLLMLSGGPDSMAMLSLVLACDRLLELGLELGALHVDYGLRGPDSTRDRVIVERACAARGLPLDVVDAAGGIPSANLQEEARHLRLAAAHEAVAGGRYDRIAIGHNLDDQAETVLYRLVKYGAPSALAGMSPRAGDIVRPLLCLRAADIREYCRRRAIDYGEDLTNSQEAYARNIIRLSVLPQLERLNPRVTEALAGAAETARAEQEVLAQLVDDAWSQVTGGAGEDVGPALDLGWLAGLTPALRRLVLRRLVQQVLDPHLLIDRRTTQALERLAAGSGGTARVSLRAGWEAVREYGRLVVRRREPPHHCRPVRVVVPEPDTRLTETSFCGSRYLIDQLAGPVDARCAPVVIGSAQPVARLVLRHPRRGERFRPLGFAADTSIAGFLREHKVPQRLRPRVLVVEVGGEVAWVGVPTDRGDEQCLLQGRVAEGFRVADSTQYTVRLRPAPSVGVRDGDQRAGARGA